MSFETTKQGADYRVLYMMYGCRVGQQIREEMVCVMVYVSINTGVARELKTVWLSSGNKLYVFPNVSSGTFCVSIPSDFQLRHQTSIGIRVVSAYDLRVGSEIVRSLISS